METKTINPGAWRPPFYERQVKHERNGYIIDRKEAAEKRQRS